MLSMSQRAPGYRLNSQVPPTFSAASSTCTRSPSSRSRCSAYRPGEAGADHDRVEPLRRRHAEDITVKRLISISWSSEFALANSAREP